MTTLTKALPFALVALVGCTLLTDIPDDVSSGARDGGADAIADVGPSDASDAREIDAEPEASGPSVVAVDAVGPTPTGTGGANKLSPIAWTHTTSGTNRALFVVIAVDKKTGDAAVKLDSVTYEGIALTLIATQHTNDQDLGYVTLWALAAPALGAHSVSVTFRGSPDAILAGSISFTGVDQATPYQNVAKVGGDGRSAKLGVTSAEGNMVVGAIASGCTIGGAGKEVGWLNNLNCDAAARNAAQVALPGAPSVSLAYSIDQDWWGMIGADVKAAGR